MGMMTAAILTIGVAQGVSEIAGGKYAENVAIAQSELTSVNAARLAQQAGFIEQMKQIQAARDDKAIRVTMGKTVSATVAKGIELSGSPAAIMVDTRAAMEMDKAIGQYNYDVEKRRLLTESKLTSLEAESIRAGGRAAKAAGITSGLVTMSKAALAAAASGFDKKPLGKGTQRYKGGTVKSGDYSPFRFK